MQSQQAMLYISDHKLCKHISILYMNTNVVWKYIMKVKIVVRKKFLCMPGSVTYPGDAHGARQGMQLFS